VNGGPGGEAGRAAPLLEIQDLVVAYGAVQALRGVSLVVGTGEIVTLIGANGAGKTTLLRTISGLLVPRQGSIRLAGVDLTRVAAHRIVGLGVSQVPEGRIVFANLTVRDNLELGAYLRRDRAGIRADLERVFTLFPRLRERERQRAGTLSGGEQQMLAIGRALMSRPRLLLMDEPSLGLAPILVREIFRTIAEISEQGMTILLVEQNAHMALGIADRGYVMETGSIVLSDSRENLLSNEEVKSAYLGG
jgi:branched-chain amino acid transport system ATP-binding protein